MSPGTTVHFVGIGGVGMSPLAELLHLRGHAVSGSDLKAGVVPAARQAVINTVVTGAPNVDDIEDTTMTQQMREVPMHEYDPDRLAASERILGHR